MFGFISTCLIAYFSRRKKRAKHTNFYKLIRLISLPSWEVYSPLKIVVHWKPLIFINAKLYTFRAEKKNRVVSWVNSGVAQRSLGATPRVGEKVQGVQEKLFFLTIHCNPSLAYIAVRDLQSSQRNVSVKSLLLAGNVCTTNSWRGRGGKLKRILGKKHNI